MPCTHAFTDTGRTLPPSTAAFHALHACGWQATTVRVNVINNATGASAANLVLGSTFLTKPSSNRWTVKIGTGGTATAPIPRAGVWRFQVALVSAELPLLLLVGRPSPGGLSSGCAPLIVAHLGLLAT